jgi:hypothetical protein
MSHRRIGNIETGKKAEWKAVQASLGLIGIKVSFSDLRDWTPDQIKQATRWARSFGEDPKTRIPRPVHVPAPDHVHGWR